MLKTINGSRRRFSGTTPMTLAATQFGALASAKTCSEAEVNWLLSPTQPPGSIRSH